MLEMVQQRYAEVGAISATFEIIAFIAVLSLILFLVLAALFARNKELSGQMSRNAMYSLAVAGVALFLGSTAASGILPFLAAFAGVLLVFFVFKMLLSSFSARLFLKGRAKRARKARTAAVRFRLMTCLTKSA